jgi:hypothetical protein
LTMNQEIVSERGFIHVRCSGNFSLPEATAKFLLIMEAVLQHQKGKVLVDVRELQGSPSTSERYLYSTFVADHVIRTMNRSCQAPRFVYLGEIPIIDPERFGETVARNRGVDAKAYETHEIKEALAWLGVVLPDESLEERTK